LIFNYLLLKIGSSTSNWYSGRNLSSCWR